MRPRTYLDWNASAPLEPAVRAVMIEAMDRQANASSVHAEGREARRLVEKARADVAALVGAKADHVVFTSGATEAAGWALSPDYRMGRSPLSMGRVYVAATDHHSLLGGGRFPAELVTLLGVDADGVVDLDGLRAALAAHDRAQGMPLVALHLANNETGVIQPASEIGRIAHEAGAVTVFDAVQAVGRIPVDISDGYADFLILSAHKIGGPQGIGALVANSDLLMPAPLVAGGGQERGHRGGTENVPAIAGFGVAAALALGRLGEMGKVRALRDTLEAHILSLAPDAIVYGRGAPRLPNTSFFSLSGMKAETAQIAFDLAGVALSAGSACSSGRIGPSHVLRAMGHDGESGLRVSIGHSTSEDDIGRFREALAGIIARQAGRKRAA